MTLRVQADFETNTHTHFAPIGSSKSAGAPCKNVPKSKSVIEKHLRVFSATTDLWKNTMKSNMRCKNIAEGAPEIHAQIYATNPQEEKMLWTRRESAGVTIRRAIPDSRG